MFKTTPTGLQGLLGGRKFLFCLSKGADYRPGAPLAAFDMLEPYLIKLLTFCGVDEADIIFIALNNALGAGGADPDDEARAQERIAELADHW